MFLKQKSAKYEPVKKLGGDRPKGNIMDYVQTILNEMTAQWQKERAETQMTLGKMIKFLESMPATVKIRGLGKLESYRGYYSDLAFEPIPGKRKATDVLVDCKTAMGKTFCGYKGGKYVMDELTPLWIAHYGMCGKKILSISASGILETASITHFGQTD